MSVYEEKVSHEITLQESGLIQIRRSTQIYKDNVAYGLPVHHRTVATPDSDLTRLPLIAGKVGEESLAALPDDVCATIQSHWTPERVAVYRAAVSALEEQINQSQRQNKQKQAR